MKTRISVVAAAMIASSIFLHGCAESRMADPGDERGAAAQDGLQDALQHIRNGEESLAADKLTEIGWEGLESGIELLRISESEFESMPQQERSTLREEALALDRDLRRLGRAGLEAADQEAGEASRELLASVRSFGQYLQEDKLAVFALTGRALSGAAEKRMGQQ